MREGRSTFLALPLATLMLTAAQAPTTEPTIGVATKEADGTIVPHLRASADSGMTGDALVRYRPGDRHYAAVARHVGPIPRGGSVFVKPFRKR